MALQILIDLKLKWSNGDVIVSQPTPIEPRPPVEENVVLFSDWETKVETGGVIELENGVTYLIPAYRTAVITKDLTITCKGKAKVIFGKDYYNKFKDSGEDRFIFKLGQWNNHIKVENVDLFSGKFLNMVEPFWRTIFWNTTEKNQTGIIELINSNTNMEYGLLYSGSQNDYLICKAINVNFEGVWFQSLKCPNGGGLLSYQRNCNLKQLDPITNFKAKLKFSKNEVESDVSFLLIENEFNGNGNSANIIYLDNMSFYLPKGMPKNEFKHHIRPIPQAGEFYDLTALTGEATQYTDGQFISNEVDFQVGDIFEYNSQQFTVIKKDRLTGNYFPQNGYSMYYKLDRLVDTNGSIKIKVVKSRGESLLDGKVNDGFMIFKYNEDFTTEFEKQPNMDLILKSNPIGVLSYNHEEITVDWENVNHDGFYRQSKSGVGSSNGYRVVNCEGLKDQWNPPVEIINI